MSHTAGEPRGVIVCGAGPAGLVAALELARQGVKARIIDANDGPTELSKALVLWRRTLKVLDAEVPVESIREGRHPVRTVQWLDAGRLVASVAMEEGAPPSPPAFPAGVMIPQSATERILLAALERRGVRVERATKLVGFESAHDGVTVSLERRGIRESARVDWLVGCDGGHSTVRKGLGIAFPGTTVDIQWLLADIEIDQQADPSIMRIEYGLDGAVAIFSLGPSRWRVITQLGEVAPELTLELVQHVLATRTSTGWAAVRAHWLGTFCVNERQVEEYRHGRIFLAGDAAHVHSPAGGQGMNTGIQDAQNLGWKLALVVRGGAGEALLDTYSAERHPVGAHVLKGSGLLLRAMMLKGALATHARDAAMRLVTAIPPLRHALRDALAEDDIQYRGGPLADGTRGGTIASGDILPNAVVHAGGGEQSLYALLRQAGATLIRVGGAAPGGETPGDLPQWFGRPGTGLPIRPVRLGPGGDAEDPCGDLTARLGGEGALVLVRPDAVVATVARSASGVQEWIDSRLIG